MIKILLFSLGWLLFVVAQGQNSVRSTANSLSGWSGFFHWLRLQAVNLATRAFFSGLFYGFIVNFVTSRIASAGLSITGSSIAGIAGYAANALLYQTFGLLPWLRVEVSDLAPAAAPAPGVSGKGNGVTP